MSMRNPDIYDFDRFQQLSVLEDQRRRKYDEAADMDARIQALAARPVEDFRIILNNPTSYELSKQREALYNEAAEIEAQIQVVRNQYTLQNVEQDD